LRGAELIQFFSQFGIRECQQADSVQRGIGGTGAWLTLICVHFDAILWLSAIILMLFLVPDEPPLLDPGSTLLEIDSGAYWVGAVLYDD